MADLSKTIKNLPSSSGVYIFKDSVGKILYIGKATSLKSRVRSYFNGGNDDRPIGAGISQIEDIEIRKTDSVLEALILEANLIKKFQPKYNVDLKDDKSFAYFIVTKEEFPRIIILRETDLDKNKSDIKFSYGPYTSKKQMEIALKIIRRIFPFHSLKQKTEKGCLDFQIGTCPGPYAKAISRPDYLKNIINIRMILEGKKKSLIGKLKKEMKKLSKQHEFERAGELRNQIFALEHIRDVALISKDKEKESEKIRPELRIEAYDISNISGKDAVGSMVVFKNREPEKSQYRKFKIKTIQGADDVGMMREVLLRRFNNNWPKPDFIFLDGGVGHLNMGNHVLKTLGLDIPVVAIAKGPTRKKLDVRFKNFDLRKETKGIIYDQNLLKQIMDEAHRFAITYHKKVRKRNFIE
jgi:excinuclease ABC subunit C